MKCIDCVCFVANQFGHNPGWCYLNPVHVKTREEDWCAQHMPKLSCYTATKGRRNLCSVCGKHKDLHE